MSESFKIDQLDQNKFIKVNELQPVTNPVMFNASNGATSDGLLSNEIFGITQAERSGIFSYINLGEKFIQPYYYKIWLKIDRDLRGCIYETQNFKIDSNGYLVQDDNGSTGINFLIKNVDKLKFKKTKKDELLKALLDGKSKGLLFTDKFVVVPPFFRDVNTNSDGRLGVGEVNKLYVNLMNNIKALNSSNDYGLELAGGIRGKIQDTMMEIFNWFTLGESIVGGEHTGSGIFKKFGIQRRSVMSKTSDYSARLVLSASNLNANSQKDLMVDLDYSAIPLSAVCVIAYPFIVYYLRNYFNNEFGGKEIYFTDASKGSYITLDNIQVEFSDDRIDKEINEFVHGYSNRFKSIKIPNKEGKNITLRLKSYNITEDEYISGKRETGSIMDRPMTWVDLLFRAAVEVTKDKMCIISRYPIDSYFNQLYTKIHVSSTIKTENIVINNTFYKWYPYIREEDIDSDTSNKFIDTCQIANPYCPLMGADYDGDQVTVKMAYSIEANKELQDYVKTNAQFITLSGNNGRVAGNEAIQAMYSLTVVLSEDKPKLTDNIKF